MWMLEHSHLEMQKLLKCEIESQIHKIDLTIYASSLYKILQVTKISSKNRCLLFAKKKKKDVYFSTSK